MTPLLTRQNARTLLPAAALLVALTLAWAWARWLYLPTTDRTTLLGPLTAGWLLLMLLLATFTTILATAHAHSSQQPNPLWRLFLGTAAISGACGLLLLLISLSIGTLRLLDALQAYLVLAAWLALIATLTATLTRCLRNAPAAAVILTATLSSLLLAAPVTCLPIIRAMNLRTQERAIPILTHLCPSLALLSSVRTSLPIGWMQMPEMYHLTTLGQDIPLPLPTWWAAALLYLALLAPLAGAFSLLRLRD